MSLAMAGSVSNGYTLSKSVRFRSSASAYLNRTPASASNRKTWTWSAWVKRGILTSGERTLFNAGVTLAGESGFLGIRFTSGDQLDVTTGSTDLRLTTQVFRDPAAWYHIVVAFDTTQATAADRIKMYVNGTQVTVFTTSNNPAQNLDTAINNTVIHEIARTSWNSAGYFDGYMAEVNFIDGQALTPSSFGFTDATTGVWQPIKYTGTYGTNGFYLPFTNITSTTTLGYDFSGNSNNWTTNNLSLTTGSTYDSMTDVPTLTNGAIANYCVVNPLMFRLSNTPGATITNGNLTSTHTPTAYGSYVWGTVGVSSGKWYWEITATTVAGSDGFGIDTGGMQNSSTAGAIWYLQNGNKTVFGSSSSYGATWTSGDVIGVALDMNAGTLTYYKNNTSQGVAATGLTGTFLPFGLGEASAVFNWNFGQQPFTYTPPTGFVALNTFNLPTSTIVKGNTVMDATTYTGNSSTQTIVNTAGFKPDLVWMKARNNANYNWITNSVTGSTEYLSSNDTISARTGVTDALTSFNSNGFSLGANTSDAYVVAGVNYTGRTYVGWQWQAGQGSTSSNTNGSITSTVSVNPTAGFSVVTYTGTGVTGTVGHGLGVAPSMVIVKVRSTTNNWCVYHASVGATQYMYLDSTQAASAGTLWNNTAPTSSVFSASSTGAGVNSNAATYVAYCWSEIAGFSKFGSYTGNGSTDGPFIYTGFRPKFIMVKRTDSIGDWTIVDTSRNPSNVVTNRLYANLSNAEDTDTPCDALSNGFKVRMTAPTWNTSGGTYIYMAFAENPFKNALAR